MFDMDRIRQCMEQPLIKLISFIYWILNIQKDQNFCKSNFSKSFLDIGETNFFQKYEKLLQIMKKKKISLNYNKYVLCIHSNLF